MFRVNLRGSKAFRSSELSDSLGSLKYVLIMTFLLLQAHYCYGNEFEIDFVGSATERTKSNVHYDGAYFSIPYPNGDVPASIGVCTDVIIRSYRGIGVDLQVLVHEDMKHNFNLYPSKRIWGLNSTDKNIDHRRVPNLQVFFKRHGQELPISDSARDYKPGNLVTWMLPGNLPHIGVVSDRLSPKTGNPLIIHNIGSGPKIDDMIFSYKITGHYKYVPEKYREGGRDAL